jgi:hypothetical protein
VLEIVGKLWGVLSDCDGVSFLEIESWRLKVESWKLKVGVEHSFWYFSMSEKIQIEKKQRKAND